MLPKFLPRGSGSGSRRTLVSRHSSTVVAEVLDFTKNLSNSLLQLTNQRQTDAINREERLLNDGIVREDKVIERKDKLLNDAVSRENKMLAETQSQRADAVAVRAS